MMNQSKEDKKYERIEYLVLGEFKGATNGEGLEEVTSDDHLSNGGIGCCGRCEVSQAKQRVIRRGKRAGGREGGGRGEERRRGEEGGERGEDMTLLVYSVVYHGKLSKTTTTQEEND